LPVTLIIIAVVLGIIYFIFLRPKKKSSSSWFQFFAKGKDAGFSFKEIELLRQLAVKSNLEDPAALFWSQNQLDVCIKSLVRSIKISGNEEDRSSQDFLAKLYDFRKKIEMEKPKFKIGGIQNSRQINEEQVLRILVEGVGVFKSHVIKNVSQYMTVARPISTKLPVNFSWQGMRISVYFWRDDDAGYVFDADILDEVYSKGRAALKIGHADRLTRTQKRKSIRVKIHKSAFLYLLVDEEDANKIEVNPGLKCFLEDLSDTGCAVTIGGKAVVDLRVKIQFSLDNQAIAVSGTVRSIEFKEDTNRSLLHIEADPLPLETRNHILGQVFGMLPEEEEDLPFRLLDEEAGQNEGGPDVQSTASGSPAEK
jgi:c-di-GMP-binding flagellar brake protein YcgR